MDTEVDPTAQASLHTASGARGVVILADALRHVGVGIGTGQVVACQQAVEQLAPADLADRYWAGRATLINDPTHLAVYDRVFRTMASVTTDDPQLPPVPPARSVAEVVAGARSTVRPTMSWRRSSGCSDTSPSPYPDGRRGGPVRVAEVSWTSAARSSGPWLPTAS